MDEKKEDHGAELAAGGNDTGRSDTEAASDTVAVGRVWLDNLTRAAIDYDIAYRAQAPTEQLLILEQRIIDLVRLLAVPLAGSGTQPTPKHSDLRAGAHAQKDSESL